MTDAVRISAGPATDNATLNLLGKLDDATARMAEARAFAKQRHRGAVLDIARRVMHSPQGISDVYARIENLEAAGVFEGTDWADPDILQAALAGRTLKFADTATAMLEVLNQDHVRTARAKGLAFAVIVWRHCLRNALIPVVTVVGLYLGILIGNSVLTEIVFNRPGLGKLIVGALNQRDYTMLQGMMVIYTLIVVLVNLVTDLTYGLIDPRIKYA